LDKNLKEKTVQAKVTWYKIEISMGRINPWKEKKSKFLLQYLVELYIKDGKKKRWNSEKTEKSVKFRLTKMMEFIPPNSVIENVKDWDWFTDLLVSPHTKKDYFSTTTAFLNWCKKNKYLAEFTLELPVKIKKTIQNKVTRYITHQELTFLGNEYIKMRQETAKFTRKSFEPERHVRMWWVMFWQLLRKEEAPGILHTDIHQGSMTVRGKGGTQKKIPIVPPAQKHIDWFKQHKQSERLFGFESMDNPKNQLRKSIAEKMPHHHSKGFHQLRHGGIVHYLSVGTPLIYVSKLARHKDTSVTAKEYADIIEGLEGLAFDDIKDKHVG
jgi:integrase